MSKNKKITLGLAITVIVYIGILLYTHSPYYILEHSAKPYITEAEQFFTQNLGQLRTLVEMARDTDEDIYYSFSSTVFNTPNIPTDIEEVLFELAKNTEKDYAVRIFSGNVKIFIANETYLQVDLTHSVPPYRELYKYERRYDFGDGWILYTLYVLRG
ncbi:hypothetical protein [Sedimentibacter sp. B4]|uniref:hypothetical protein n=1 Tax=Sedimentibacter sp. B4 TaxID=304766 RepID=UPI0004B27339|nr:hypothetical protein [Sedimentibacter sp. B4]